MRDSGASTFQTRAAPTRQGSVVDPAVLKMSILSSVEDKLRNRINEVYEQAKVGRVQFWGFVFFRSEPFSFFNFVSFDGQSVYGR